MPTYLRLAAFLLICCSSASTLWAEGTGADVPAKYGRDIFSEVGLEEAVRKFNEVSRRDDVGSSQPPLTASEVIAAIQDWNRNTHSARPSVRTMYRRAAETRVLPAGMYFTASSGWYAGDHHIEAWKISLNVTTPGGSKDARVGYGYSYPIRVRRLSSRPLTAEERTAMARMLEEAEAAQLEQERTTAE